MDKKKPTYPPSRLVANIITAMVLVGILFFVVFSFFSDFHKFFDKESGMPVVKSIVAFSTTFIVLLIIVATIYLVKFFTEKREAGRKPMPINFELEAVLMASILAFEKEGHTPLGPGFIVRKIKYQGNSWRLTSSNTYEGIR